jgi:hypothetical protein
MQLKIFNKQEPQIIPLLCLILFPVFLGLDLFTTHLASPDLRKEANPIIRYFDWGWKEVLLFVFLYIIVVIFLAVLSNKRYNKILHKKIILSKNNLTKFLS